MTRVVAVLFAAFSTIAIGSSAIITFACAFNQSTVPPLTWPQCQRRSAAANPLHLAKRSITSAKKSRRKAKQQSLASLLELETDLRAQGYRYVIGTDDTGGAGCIAGPVVVASCCVLVPHSCFLPLAPSLGMPPPPSGEAMPAVAPAAMAALGEVNDCKVLTSARRKEIFDVVTSRPDLFAVSVARRSPAQIDEVNLARATQEAFAESIETLVESHDLPFEQIYAVTDGKVSPKLYASQRRQPAGASEESEMASEGQLKPLFSVRPYVNADAHVYTVALASIIARQARDDLMLELDAQQPLYGFANHSGYGTREHIEALHRLGSLEGIHRMSFKQVKGR